MELAPRINEGAADLVEGQMHAPFPTRAGASCIAFLAITGRLLFIRPYVGERLLSRLTPPDVVQSPANQSNKTAMARRDQQKFISVPPQPSARDTEDTATVTAGCDGRAHYVESFRRLAPRIENQMSDPEVDERKRLDRLAEVERCLLDIEIEPLPEVEALADALEGKLGELIDAMCGDWRGALQRRVPGNLPSADQLRRLLRPVAVRERRFLFCGRIESVLYEYRDQERALTKLLRKQHLDKMRRHARQFACSAQELLGYFVVAQVAQNDRLSEQLTEAIAMNEGIVAQLESMTTDVGDAGLNALLEANGNQLRAQFTVACAVTCLTVYGNVSVAHLRTLLGLKHLQYLTHWTTDFIRSTDGRNDLRMMGRQLERALRMASRSAQKQALPVEPVLRMFELDTPHSRLHERKRPRADDEGLAEHRYPGD